MIGPIAYDGRSRWPESCKGALAKNKGEKAEEKEEEVAEEEKEEEVDAEAVMKEETVEAEEGPAATGEGGNDGVGGNSTCQKETENKSENDKEEAEENETETNVGRRVKEDEVKGEEECAAKDQPDGARDENGADKSVTSTTSNYSDACSEATEGPEEGFDEDQNALNLDAYLNEAEEMEAEAAIYHHSRIPRSLLAEENEDDEDDDDEKEEEDEGDEMERSNARTFVEKLGQSLDHIVAARGSVETDYRVQKFASDFCHGRKKNFPLHLLVALSIPKFQLMMILLAEFSTHSPDTSKNADVSRVIILNADGVYLTVYCALQLGLKLCKEGGYSAHGGGSDGGDGGDGDGDRSRDFDVRATAGERQRFVDSVLNGGLLVYVSPAWLAEVFDTVSEVDALGLAAREEQGRLGGLRALLADLEGFGETQRGAQMLTDFKRFRQDVARITTNVDDESNDSDRRVFILYRRKS